MRYVSPGSPAGTVKLLMVTLPVVVLSLLALLDTTIWGVPLGLPVPPSFELTEPVVLTLLPVVDDVTVAVTVQLPPPGIEPPVSWMDVDVEAETKPPAHVVATPDWVMPVGKGSVTCTPVSVVLAFGLLIVRVRVEVPPTGMPAGENVFVIVGPAMAVKVADAVVPVVFGLVEVTVPVVLFRAPALVALTLTETEQLLLIGIDPPLRLIEVAFAAGEKVPPQVFAAPGVLATCNPDGKVSLTATPVRATVLAAGLVMVRVRVDV